MNRKLWLLMTWLLVVPAFVQAASVRGVVVDYETNKPIANVKVAIRNVSAVTDFDGNFELKKVRAGSVVVVFTAADYKAYSVDFVVNDGVNTLNASLQPKKVDNTLNQQALEDNIFEPRRVGDRRRGQCRISIGILSVWRCRRCLFASGQLFV